MNPVAQKLTEAMRLWEAHPTTVWGARDKKGDPCKVASSAAVCWCAKGAILKVCGPSTPMGTACYQFLSSAADALVDDGLEILDEPAMGITSAEVQLRRGRADYRKWLASVRNRTDYGDHGTDVNVNIDIGQLHLDALRHAGSAVVLERREPERIEAEVVEDE